MDELSQLLSGAGQAAGVQGGTGQAGSGLGGLLGELSGGAGAAGTAGAGGLSGLGQLGSLLGGATGASIPGAPAAGGGLMSALANLPTLLPALLAMLGGLGANGQSGLHQVMSSLEAQGLGHVGQSWVGNGPNQAVSAQQIEQALGSAQVGQLAAQTGLPANQVTQGVAAVLPSIVHSLTPTGQLPEPAQVSQLLGGLMGRP
ncbi:MAG TPA: YidB family protein [Candidatus Limnocylindrales bacterium]|jgi:uncharacterized protein YidB (DUF937 family)